MKGIFLFAFTLFSFSSGVLSQTMHWVFLSDKRETTFDPLEYFDAKAIERRVIMDLPLCDSTDFPLNENFVRAIAGTVDSVAGRTRWFNAVAVYANAKQLEILTEYPFVTKIQPSVFQTNQASSPYDTVLSIDQKSLLRKQTSRMEAEKFRDAGIDGKGVRVAIFDGGFPTVDIHPAFEHIRNEGRIIKTYDFARNKEFVYGYNTHGTMVMSCIGGRINGINIGLATGAEFLLARTEVATEPFSEEKNWMEAVEWADKNGAEIINSSLGYTYNRYFKEQMDGKTSLVARAANLAASKGILVVNAMGNDGDSKWEVVGTPADADSVLSIGGINPDLNYHTSFSSYGPTTDKRLKPNVCAFGHVVAAGKNGLGNTQGTSFSSPLVAGFSACAWQVMKGKTNMEMFKEIEKSGDLYPYFDYAHGYGVPQASYFVEKKDKENFSTFEFKKDDTKLRVVINAMAYDEGKYLYYHIQNKEGHLDYYAVLKVSDKVVLSLDVSDYKDGEKVRVCYSGYVSEYTF